MITFSVKRQDSYSRGLLLLRTLFGVIYIAIPHLVMLLIFSIWAGILSFISWWVILFTGTYPQNFFDYQVKLMRWGARVGASLNNLTDESASYGLEGSSESVTLEVPYPESLSRGTLILRTLFGLIYVGIPHGICLYGRLIASVFVQFIAWWIVLFTGEYPENMFNFVVGTSRWMNRVSLYMGYMSDVYPPFSGKE